MLVDDSTRSKLSGSRKRITVRRSERERREVSQTFKYAPQLLYAVNLSFFFKTDFVKRTTPLRQLAFLTVYMRG
jgi:hypothetical protein